MALKINRKLQLISRILGWAVVIILVGAVIKLLIWEENYYVSKSAEKRNDPTPVLTEINIPLNIDDTKNDPDQHHNGKRIKDDRWNGFKKIIKHYFTGVEVGNVD